MNKINNKIYIITNDKLWNNRKVNEWYLSRSIEDKSFGEGDGDITFELIWCCEYHSYEKIIKFKQWNQQKHENGKNFIIFTNDSLITQQ